jgi:ribosomal protein L16 Arg81 hydroxylase
MALEERTILSQGNLGFGELIAPMSSEQFVTEYWQKKPCYIPGARNKFQHLFSWAKLNHLLEEHHFAYPRFRMSKSGADVQANEYIETLRYTKGKRVDGDGLRRQLAQGATIILMHADEFSSDLTCLANALEAGLGWHAEVGINAGCGTLNGLGIHFDQDDCVAFQITGTKRWRFYEPTRVAPLGFSHIFPHRYDVLPAPQPNPDAPALTVEVTAGDFVYAPRGWWHLVEPLPGPCLSLNPTVYSATMQDFLRWVVDELSIEEACRGHIPSDNQSQQAILQHALSALARRLNPEMIGKYRAFLANEMEGPRSVDLLGESPWKQPIDVNSSVKATARKPLHVTADETSPVFRLRWKGTDKHFPKEYLRVLLILNDGQAHQVADVLAPCLSPEGRLLSLAFLLDLWQEGIVVRC